MPANELSALARRFACSNPHDAAEQKSLLDALCAIRKPLDPEKERAACEAIDGALLLTSYMTRMGHVGGPHVLGIIARLLETAAEDAAGNGAQAPARPADPAAAGAPSAAPGQASAGALQAVRNMLLGEILVTRGIVRQQQIIEALRHQRRAGGRFGDAIVALGLATSDQVNEALSYQSSARGVADQFAWRDEHPQEPSKAPQFRKLRVLPRDENSEEGPLRLMSDVLLGEVLVRNGTISKAQLEEALKSQRAMGLRLGEALVRSGALTKIQLDCALQLQHKMRKRA